AHVASTCESKIKGPWNRRGTESQYINQSTEHFKFFFVQHAESLFLIDHDETEVFEGSVVLQQTMGADHNVHGSRGQILNHALLSPAAAKTRKQLDADGIIRHALAKGIVMLLGENRCRHEHGDLATIHYRLEGRPDAYLGFAKTNIATDEPIHGFRPLHVSLG